MLCNFPHMHVLNNIWLRLTVFRHSENIFMVNTFQILSSSLLKCLHHIVICSDPFGQQKCIQNSFSSLALTYHKLIYGRTILKIQIEKGKGMDFILEFKANVEAT